MTTFRVAYLFIICISDWLEPIDSFCFVYLTPVFKLHCLKPQLQKEQNNHVIWFHSLAINLDCVPLETLFCIGSIEKGSNSNTSSVK